MNTLTKAAGDARARRMVFLGAFGRVSVRQGDVVRIRFGRRGRQLALVERVRVEPDDATVRNLAVRKFSNTARRFTGRFTVQLLQVFTRVDAVDLPRGTQDAFREEADRLGLFGSSASNGGAP